MTVLSSSIGTTARLAVTALPTSKNVKTCEVIDPQARDRLNKLEKRMDNAENRLHDIEYSMYYMNRGLTKGIITALILNAVLLLVLVIGWVF